MLSRPYLVIIGLSLSFFSILFSLLKGSSSTSLQNLWVQNPAQFSIIVFKLRLPRTIAAFVTGALLALGGKTMQLLLENPLADPYALGLSSGAAFITLLLMCLGVSEYYVLTGAWVGSLLTMLLILLLAKKHRFQTHALLLSGMAIACGFSAGISLILLLSPASHLHGMLFWLTGDLNDARFPYLQLGILIIGFCLCFLLAPGLNILGRGEKEARALGLASEKYRLLLYLLSSLFTAAAVTLAGCIGFIGLIIPHLTRLIAGFDHRITLPLAFLFGGSLLTLADTLARTLFAPQQIPVGMLIVLLGIPVFIWLIQR